MRSPSPACAICSHGSAGAATHPACSAHLADRLCEDLDDLLVRCGHHALPVDLDDAVPHTDAALLSDAPTHQAADLGSKECW